MTTTKNLFDISRLQAYTPETLPTNTAGVYNGNIIARAGVGDSASGSTKTLKELCPNIEAGKTYTIHFNTTATGSQAQSIYLRGAESGKGIWYNGESRIVSVNDLTATVTFYANYPERTVATISNFQIELGNTATDYVPYGYLPMYKGRYKVGDVCQLLDKSKYPATKTVNGVTFTNNGDGTITANGTATDRAVLLLFYKTLPIIRGKGLIIGDPTPGYAFINYTFYDNKGKWLTDNASYGGNGVIFTGKDDVAYTELYIAIEAGSTANNIIFKPQLFDLTEMYGAGNEPTTVEEFREKFPDELYPYSPYCWAKMKQMRYLTTTKNLFNQVGAALIRSDNSAAPVSWYSWKGSKIYINYGLYSYGLYFQPITLSAGTYTLSAMASMNDINGSGRYVSIGYKDNSNNSHTQYVTISSDNQKISYTFTLTEETIIRINLQGIGNSSNSFNLDTSFWDIQLEEGSTATPYVPYGYLSLK